MTYHAVVASQNDADVEPAQPGRVAFRTDAENTPLPEARRLHPYYFKRLKEQK